MPDNFVDNFRQLGQELFRKRNERRAQAQLDKELERELVKIAAQAGYSRDQAREIAQLQIEGAKERQAMQDNTQLEAAHMGEVSAENRRKAAASDETERWILNNLYGREAAGINNDAAIQREKVRSEGDVARDAAAWEREQPYRSSLAKIKEQDAIASAVNAGALYSRDVGELTPAMRKYLGLPDDTGTSSLGAPAKPTSPARISLKPTKPGETPRNPDSAARPIPVTPAAAPSAVVKSNDVPSLGTPPAPELNTTNAPITWRDIPVIPSGDRSERAIIDEYIQQLVGRPAVKISPK